MQLAIWCPVKSFHTKIFILKQFCFRHFNSALLGKKRITVFIYTYIVRISLGTELNQPFLVIITNEDFRSCTSR